MRRISQQAFYCFWFGVSWMTLEIRIKACLQKRKWPWSLSFGYNTRRLNLSLCRSNGHWHLPALTSKDIQILHCELKFYSTRFWMAVKTNFDFVPFYMHDRKRMMRKFSESFFISTFFGKISLCTFIWGKSWSVDYRVEKKVQNDSMLNQIKAFLWIFEMKKEKLRNNVFIQNDPGEKCMTRKKKEDERKK